MDEIDLTEDFLCESCGFTSPVSNDTCPQCGSAMQGSATKKRTAVGDDGDDELSDAPEDESLEELREKEAGAESSADSYDDSDNDL